MVTTVMQHYHGLVHKDKSSAYGVQFPDLPGCFSAADDLNDLVASASEAIALYLEDAEEIPAPSDFATINAAVADDLREGAFLILVPYIRDTGRVVRVNVSLDEGMLDAIDAEAARRKVNRSAFLAAAARNMIEERA